MTEWLEALARRCATHGIEARTKYHDAELPLPTGVQLSFSVDDSRG